MKLDLDGNIRHIMSQYIEIDETDWARCSSLFTYRKLRRREVLVRDGEMATNIYFVISGMLRLCRVDSDGQERTFHFSNPNTFAVDYEQFLRQAPSRYMIQATENATVAIVSLESLNEFYATFRFGERLGRVIAEKYLFLLSDRIQSIYTQTPLERFNNMKKQFPDIMQKVPQRQIASYLNISPVHLSRLKKADLMKP